MQTPSPFKEYLECSRHQSVRRLLKKAYTANHIAKLSTGVQRARLYDLKHRYIISAICLLPETFRGIGTGPQRPHAPMLGVQSRMGFAFHIPDSKLPVPVQRLMYLQ